MGAKNYERVFAINCFSPDTVFKAITDLNPLSMIITSGTLAPIDTLEKEIGVPFA